jgi:U3 small nucleolar RNA-associated protein 15
VSSSIKVRFFSYANTNDFSLSKFKAKVCSMQFRSDGELFAAGDELGKLNLFQVSRKTLLRTYKHPAPVYGVSFAEKSFKLLSGCDDRALRVWDLTMKHPVITWADAHDDYLRSVAELSEFVVVSGGLDGKVRIWDMRTQARSAELDHLAPVSVVLPVSEVSLVTAGHTRVTNWDLRTLTPVTNYTPHSKNITALALNSTKDKLLTGSLDCNLKIHSLEDSKVLHSIKYPAPISTVTLTYDDAHLVVGMTDGKVSVRQRKHAKAPKPKTSENPEDLFVAKWEQALKERPVKLTKDYGYFKRGAYSKPDVEDLTLDKQVRKKLQDYDKLLKKFRYSEVLDCVLQTDRPDLIVSIIQELAQRNVLADALKNRAPVSPSQSDLVPVISWLTRKIGVQKYAEAVLRTTDLLLGKSQRRDVQLRRSLRR